MFMSDKLSILGALFSEVSCLIEEAKQRVAVAVNAELTILYWRIGTLVNGEVLQEKRATMEMI